MDLLPATADSAPAGRDTPPPPDASDDADAAAVPPPTETEATTTPSAPALTDDICKVDEDADADNVFKAGDENDEEESSLVKLSRQICAKYPNLKSTCAFSDAAGEEFVSVSCRSYAGPLPFQPALCVVVTQSDELSYVARLMTFHGKILQTETVRVTSLDDDDACRLDSKLLVRLDCLRLCPGLESRPKTTKLKRDELLVERLNQSVVYRSLDCAYAVTRDDQDDCKSRCPACAGLVKKRALGRPKKNFPRPIDEAGMVDVDVKEDVDEMEDFYFDQYDDSDPDFDPGDEEDQKPVLSIGLRLPNTNTRVIDSSQLLEVKDKLKRIKKEEEEDGGDDDVRKHLDERICEGAIQLVKSPANGGGAARRPRGRPRKGVVVAGGDGDYDDDMDAEEEVPRKRGRPRKYPRPPGYEPPTKKKPKIPARPKEQQVMQQCRVCLFQHDKPFIFERHTEAHEQRFNLNEPVACPRCSVEFDTKYELNPHFQAEHDQAKGCCVECQEVMEAKLLRRHLEYTHYIQVKNKLCSVCGEKFRNKQDLDIHIGIMHEKTMDQFICDHCGKTFPHPKMLNKHFHTMHVYNNKGPFRCPFCEKVFDKTLAWHKHLKIHSKTKPYRCGFCDYRSVNRFNVRLHMRKRHNQDATYADLVKDCEFDYGVPTEKLEIVNYVIKEKPPPLAVDGM